jgi:hypothetical protein
MRGGLEELNQSEGAYAHPGKLGDKGFDVLKGKMKEESERARYTGNNGAQTTWFTW